MDAYAHVYDLTFKIGIFLLVPLSRLNGHIVFTAKNFNSFTDLLMNSKMKKMMKVRLELNCHKNFSTLKNSLALKKFSCPKKISDFKKILQGGCL